MKNKPVSIVIDVPDLDFDSLAISENDSNGHDVENDSHQDQVNDLVKFNVAGADVENVEDIDFIDERNVKIKGSTYYESSQKCLKLCCSLVSKQIPIPIDLEFEPDNPVDKNAIKVMAKLEDRWQQLGYIPGCNVQEITTAIKDLEYTDTTWRT